MKDILDWLTAPLQFTFMQTALMAAVLIGLACASIGVYVVLRRMAFIGDALSHTILPGVVVAYLNGFSLSAGALLGGTDGAKHRMAVATRNDSGRYRNSRGVHRYVCRRNTADESGTFIP